ncbi:KRAB-A domain-containing protein 2-like [Belonocnema kinseyi]|uniref:KRAB-A domain-containing protein 2-like n=1 Tax=Belonocnema kinseyi TaxID=2817044 RepID=UPI00143D419A|nr:KRAB-A domain-containing protein 2-like [Belonocnema kinseyi]
MQTNQTKHRAEGLRFVQMMKNCSFHQDIQKSPYGAMFGCKEKVGLSTSNLPNEVIEQLKTQEDLEKAEKEMRNSMNHTTSLDSVNMKINDSAYTPIKIALVCNTGWILFVKPQRVHPLCHNIFSYTV